MHTQQLWNVTHVCAWTPRFQAWRDQGGSRFLAPRREKGSPRDNSTISTKEQERTCPGTHHPPAPHPAFPGSQRPAVLLSCCASDDWQSEVTATQACPGTPGAPRQSPRTSCTPPGLELPSSRAACNRPPPPSQAPWELLHILPWAWAAAAP